MNVSIVLPESFKTPRYMVGAWLDQRRRGLRKMSCNCMGGNPCPCMGGKIPGRMLIPPMEVTWGVYECRRCQKAYTVNEPGSWRLCTADFCHDCYAYLKEQYASVPVGKDGKDVPQ